MKYAFITFNGDSLPIARRLQLEGNYVLVGRVSDYKNTGNSEKKEDPEEKRRRHGNYDGIMKIEDADELVKYLIALKDKSDWFVACDFNYLYPYADKLREAGFRGLLPHKLDFELEKDRAKAKNLVEERYENLKVLPNWEFKTIKDGIKHMEESQDMLFVLKSNGEGKTVCPITAQAQYNHQEIANALEGGKKDYEQSGFILEEKIPDIIEFTPEAIAFDGQLLGVSVDLELKCLGAGNIGHQTGCSADLCFWQDLDSYVYEQFLKPMEKEMLRPGELTIWDAAVGYSPSRGEFYFLEYCSDRWGYDAIFTELASFQNVTEYFEKLVKKVNLYSPTTLKYSASVRIFDLSKSGEFKELPKGGSWFSASNHKDVWLWDVVKSKDEMKTIGSGEDMAILTGADNDPEVSIEKAYSLIDQDFIWSDGYFRPKFDILNFEYEGSIPNRLNILVQNGFVDADSIYPPESFTLQQELQTSRSEAKTAKTYADTQKSENERIQAEIQAQNERHEKDIADVKGKIKVILEND